MNYKECLKWMYAQLPIFQRMGKAAYKANLDNTYAIMEVLDNPQNKFKSIHIAGTNGKGSTSHLIASVFQEAGYKTGLYTSPHLKDFRERIRINGEMIPEAKVLDFIEGRQKKFEEIQPSFFEMTVGMAFKYFADQKVDIAILETGMGGRLDSTNIVNPELSVITNIALDHTQFLGDTIGKIAGEKAGIIKKEVPLIIGEFHPETFNVFQERANELSAPMILADEVYQIEKSADQYSILKNNQMVLGSLSIPLFGNYQKKNIITAFAACRQAGMSLEHIKLGFENVLVNTNFTGRWQIIGKEPKVIADTAHNEAGLSLVMEQLSLEKYRNLHMVISVVDDKNLQEILKYFPKTAQYYFCKADIPRGLAVESLQKQAEELGLLGKSYYSVAKACQAALKQATAEDLVFIGGSTFTVAEVL
ncbi:MULTISPECIES: folylpolyglutamate synthase/dihydrofolate synthase family protein [unclassified Lentimicrobium]|uniref:bifunctional folylpolyglutamate synthase/dihydrofolate synthase n=1 Tax=unclassified Lentimicrobium TaxID=2677434 RepID=UPI0015519306|nr:MULTISPECIES: folylpolyglutamate synthase/dihydrofolate synthase family protein [unclassified Lentimicrobium]NPD45776.1 bifunctional folylpolyglutamate synthase/dihydrofolate synthase [Lentimicrobium sp. S6]NPD84791.1 bifunctional folylpolyglutamate synthase/dihydrofolate synthase [Lentimicrobium sp. L6]